MALFAVSSELFQELEQFLQELQKGPWPGPSPKTEAFRKSSCMLLPESPDHSKPIQTFVLLLKS